MHPYPFDEWSRTGEKKKYDCVHVVCWYLLAALAAARAPHEDEVLATSAAESDAKHDKPDSHMQLRNKSAFARERERFTVESNRVKAEEEAADRKAAQDEVRRNAEKDEAEHWKTLGNEKLKTGGQTQEAVDCYTKAIELDPTSAVYYANRFQINIDKKNNILQ